ncbi:MAG: dihydroorotase [Putridiphycobacter sp.]|nr:dihydroorotase [Putridiphycobacter sp.]
MKILLKSCTIIDPQSQHHLQKRDILIDGQKIEKIDDNIGAFADKTVDITNLHVSQGWYDAKVNFQDPGLEYKEDITSGIKASELGGMTAVSVTPNTTPRISNKTQIDYVKNKASFSPVDIFPYGTLTEGGEGKNIAEYYDMSQAGAVGFTDAHEPVSAGIMYRALLYMKNTNSLVVSFPYDYSIFGKGQVNESRASLLTGLKSIPSISEYLIVERDLSLLAYTEGRLHFSGISTLESVDLIRAAKQKGLAVTADAYAHHIMFNDESVLDFDSNFKVLPPLRSEKDRLALIKGLKDGTIDFVCSDHTPEDTEHKDLEFDLANFGMIGTQTLFSSVNSIDQLSLVEKIACISRKPRQIMCISNPIIEAGQFANMTLFDPALTYTLASSDLASLSKNTPLIGKELTGKALGIINKGIISIFED